MVWLPMPMQSNAAPGGSNEWKYESDLTSHFNLIDNFSGSYLFRPLYMEENHFMQKSEVLITRLI